MRLIYWSVLLFIMWMVLTSNTQIANIFVGLGVSICVASLYVLVFRKNDFEFVHPVWFLIYIYVLMKNLIIANLQISKKILSKDMKLSPAIVAVKTNLKSDWKKLLLANSITLTPGTLTLDIEDDMLYIHVIECRDVTNKENITKEFENVISKL